MDWADFYNARASRILEKYTGACHIGVNGNLPIRQACGWALAVNVAADVLVCGHALTPCRTALPDHSSIRLRLSPHRIQQ